MINADDFGISLGTNRAIIEGHTRGAITSASLMMNMPACDDALVLARQQPALEIGLHVCLTSGRPVLPGHQVPLLVDRKGRFRHSFAGLWRLLRAADHAVALDQIEAEIEAQWQLAVSCGAPLGHLDSHQHVHMIPALFPCFASLARRVNVPLRVSTEPLRIDALARVPAELPHGAMGSIKALLLKACARRHTKLSDGIRRSDVCYGIVDSGRMTTAILLQLLPRLPNGVVEIITHPSSETSELGQADFSDLDRRFLASDWRRLEFEAVTDARVREAVRALLDGDEFRRIEHQQHELSTR